MSSNGGESSKGDRTRDWRKLEDDFGMTESSESRLERCRDLNKAAPLLRQFVITFMSELRSGRSSAVGRVVAPPYRKVQPVKCGGVRQPRIRIYAPFDYLRFLEASENMAATQAPVANSSNAAFKV